MSRKKPEQLRNGVDDSPVYWFSRYESAVLRDDLNDARTARERLEQLGFVVDRREDHDEKGGA